MLTTATGTSPNGRKRRDTGTAPFVIHCSASLARNTVRVRLPVWLRIWLFWALGSLPSLACSEATEAARVELRVVTDGTALDEVTTDLGYAVKLSDASVAASDLKFTIAGEAHSSLGPWLSRLLLPVAHAHPGHYQGGEITGELPGQFLLRFSPGKVHTLGSATLLVGSYHAVNLTLSTSPVNEGDEHELVSGHTAALSGTATKADVSVEFEIVLDSPKGRELVGIPFEEEVTASTKQVLALRLSPLDPLEMDTLFDGIDFAALDNDEDGHVSIAPAATDEGTVAAYNLVRRSFQTHDHFVVHLQK
jgi:hypothetical protein